MREFFYFVDKSFFQLARALVFRLRFFRSHCLILQNYFSCLKVNLLYYLQRKPFPACFRDAIVLRQFLHECLVLVNAERFVLLPILKRLVKNSRLCLLMVLYRTTFEHLFQLAEAFSAFRSLLAGSK